jgi:hypothetical protein
MCDPADERDLSDERNKELDELELSLDRFLDLGLSIVCLQSSPKIINV